VGRLDRASDFPLITDNLNHIGDLNIYLETSSRLLASRNRRDCAQYFVNGESFLVGGGAKALVALGQ
jgi:hypothetical protein